MTVPSILLCLLLGCLVAVTVPAAEEEAVTLKQATSPGPKRSEALRRLGEQPPKDAVAVAKALVDAAVGSDLACQFAAGSALRSLLLYPDEGNVAVATAVAKHADRLLTAAEADRDERTNTALEVLSLLTLDSAVAGPRLIPFLAPGRSHRQYSVAALAKCRPLTPDIRRCALGQAGGQPLTQQNLAFALRAWPVAELDGADVDQALGQLFDTVMGNVHPLVVEIAQRRGKPSPLFAARLLALIDHPATRDNVWNAALAAYAVTAGSAAEQALLERLLVPDPRQDPARSGVVIAALVKRPVLSPAMVARLAALLRDGTQSWWLRHRVARVLVGKTTEAELTALVAERAAYPEWIVQVDSAPGWPRTDPTLDRIVATAKADDERTAASLTKELIRELDAHKKDADFNQRRGAVQVACVARWAAAHPDAAWQAKVVVDMLHGFHTNYAPTPAEQTQAADYVAALIGSGFFSDASLATMRYPQGGPVQIADQVVSTLVWAVTPPRVKNARKGSGDAPANPLVEAVRRLHAAKAPPIVLLQADRALASSIVNDVRENRSDPANYRAALTTSGFSLLPIERFLAELAHR